MEEYEFVQNPPKDLSCMICFKVLREPHLTDCCGQHFCGVCLQQWFHQPVNRGKKICPHCRSNSFSYIRYLPLKRKINALQVYCPFKIYGCGEIATVSEIESHKSVCGFGRVLCSQGCGISTFRMNLAHHLDQKCPKRKIKCPYCGIVDCFDDITGKYQNTCPDYPVKCPRGCSEGNSIKRKDLVHHAEVCPLEQVPCSFSEAGCNVVVLRKNLKVHVESNLLEHLTMMMTSHEKLKEECRRLSSQVKTLTLAEPVKLNAHGRCFSFRPSLSRGWVSPPFYILDGYKFCFKHKNGDKVSLLLLRGEYDDKLKWPPGLKYELTLTFDKVENQKTLMWTSTCQNHSELRFHLYSYSYIRSSKGGADFNATDQDLDYSQELAEQDLPRDVKEVLKYNLKVTLIEASSCNWHCRHCGVIVNGIQYGEKMIISHCPICGRT